MGEKLKVQFRAEAFNLFNRTNMGAGVSDVVNNLGATIKTAGQLRTTITTSRQIQLGLKFIW